MNLRMARCLVLLPFLLGCSQGVDWQGTWVGERQVQAKPGADPIVVLTMKQVQLTIKDGSYELIQEGIPRSGPIRTSGKTATLVAAAVAGREPTQSIPDAKLTFNEDGSITLIDPSLEEEPVTLLRYSEK